MAHPTTIVGWTWWADYYCPDHAEEMGITWDYDEADAPRDPEGNIAHPIFGDAEFDIAPGCGWMGCDEILDVRLTDVGHALLMDEEG